MTTDPLMADRTGKDKKGKGDTDDPRWEGEELFNGVRITFGKQRLRVKVGDVLIMMGKGGGLHTFTFAGVGAKGEILVFDNTRDRNENIANNLKARNPDNRGNVHEMHDITAPTVNGKENPYSPENGAKILGQHRASSEVTLKQLEEAADKLKVYYSPDGSQCYNYSRDLAKASGVTLIPPLSSKGILPLDSGYLFYW